MRVVAAYLHPTVSRLMDEGRFDHALEVLGEGAYCARAQGLDEEFVSCLIDRAILLRHRGEPGAALEALDEAEATVRSIDDPNTVVIALRMRAALTSLAWPTIDRLSDELSRSATRGDDVGFAAWAVSEEAASLLRAGDPAGAASLYATLAETDHPAAVSGVPLTPAAGLAAALRQLGCLAAASTVLVAAEQELGDDDGTGGVRLCVLLAERCRLLAALDRADAAEDVRRELESRAHHALRRLEGRILELARGGRSRPTTFLVAAMRDWESVARALGSRWAAIRCWLVADDALTRLDPGADVVVQETALRLLSETAQLEGFDRVLRRVQALQTMVHGGVDR
jgi:hypothetical protein